MTTFPPHPLLTAWGCSDCCLGLTTQPFMVLKPECEEGVRSMQGPGQALQDFLCSSREVCGKRQEKDWSLIKRSARLLAVHPPQLM